MIGKIVNWTLGIVFVAVLLFFIVMVPIKLWQELGWPSIPLLWVSICIALAAVGVGRNDYPDI